MAVGKERAEFLAYDLTPGLGDFIEQRFQRVYPEIPYQYLCNEHPDQLSIPRADGSVDVLTCYERLDHFDDPEPLLNEMRRVAAPGARAVICVSGRFYPHLYRYRRMRKKNYALGRNWNRGPERKYNPGEIEHYFRKSGWKVVSRQGFQPVTLKFFSLAEKVSRKLGRTEWADYLTAARTNHILTTGWDRSFCSSLIYELEPV